MSLRWVLKRQVGRSPRLPGSHGHSIPSRRACRHRWRAQLSLSRHDVPSREDWPVKKPPTRGKKTLAESYTDPGVRRDRGDPDRATRITPNSATHALPHGSPVSPTAAGDLRSGRWRGEETAAEQQRTTDHTDVTDESRNAQRFGDLPVRGVVEPCRPGAIASVRGRGEGGAQGLV
jgi:hypothetical protein